MFLVPHWFQSWNQPRRLGSEKPRHRVEEIGPPPPTTRNLVLSRVPGLSVPLDPLDGEPLRQEPAGFPGTPAFTSLLAATARSLIGRTFDIPAQNWSRAR